MEAEKGSREFKRMNVRDGMSVEELTREFAGAGLFTVSDSITYNELVGEMGAQTWTSLSRVISGEVPTIVLADAKSGQDKTYNYDYLAQDDAGVVIGWEFFGRREEFDNGIIFGGFELLLSAGAYGVSVLYDKGVDNFNVAVVGGSRRRDTININRACQSFLPVWTGSSFLNLHRMYYKWREGSRWKL